MRPPPRGAQERNGERPPRGLASAGRRRNCIGRTADLPPARDLRNESSRTYCDFTLRRSAKMPRVSLRGEPLERDVTLPDGTAVHIRIGVPQDSYIAQSELDTVAIELS